jgi:hypothetical protein
MKRLSPYLITIAAIAATAFPMMARAALSPHETISQTIDDNKITISYGRPYIKKGNTGDVRKIWGALVPYGKVWRTGADQATTLTTDQPLVIGGTTIEKGKYTLWTLPVEDGVSKLVINKQTGQWGTQYDEKQDLARVDLKKEALDDTVDQFTIVIEKNDSGGGVLKLKWEKTQFSVPFTVKK